MGGMQPNTNTALLACFRLRWSLGLAIRLSITTRCTPVTMWQCTHYLKLLELVNIDNTIDMYTCVCSGRDYIINCHISADKSLED